MSDSVKHKLVTGQTDSGKTWLMKQLAASLRKKFRQQTVVFTSADFNGWPVDSLFVRDVDGLEYLLSQEKQVNVGGKTVVRAKYAGAFIFIDEAADLFEEVKEKKHRNVHTLLRRGRHKGYTITCATQFPISIPKKFRRLFSEVYSFRLFDKDDCDMVWANSGKQNIGERRVSEVINTLERLHYVHILPTHAYIGSMV